MVSSPSKTNTFCRFATVEWRLEPHVWFYLPGIFRYKYRDYVSTNVIPAHCSVVSVSLNPVWLESARGLLFFHGRGLDLPSEGGGAG